MTAQEVIDKLKQLPPETPVIWEDTDEGDDCEMLTIYTMKFYPGHGATDHDCAYMSPVPQDRLSRYLKERVTILQ